MKTQLGQLPQFVLQLRVRNSCVEGREVKCFNANISLEYPYPRIGTLKRISKNMNVLSVFLHGVLPYVDQINSFDVINVFTYSFQQQIKRHFYVARRGPKCLICLL